MTLRRVTVYLARGVQVTLAGLAALFLAAGLWESFFAFVMLGVFALVLLGFVGVVELLAVRPLRGGTDG